MDDKKILILTNRVPYPLTDGGNIAMHAMIQGYKRAGWKVMLLSMNTSRHYVNLDSLPVLYREIAFETFDIDTDVRFLPVVKNFLLSRKPNHVERFYHKDFQKKLQEVIETFEPNWIQLESIFLASYIPAIRSVTSAKVMIRLHNVEHTIWEQLASETANTLRRYYLRDLASRIRKFEIEIWQIADFLLPISQADAEMIQGFQVQTPMIVVPVGITIQQPSKYKIQENWCGYHIGAMDWVPNMEGMTWFLEDIWPLIHRQTPAFQFWFAGRGMPASYKKYEKDGVFCAGEVEDAAQFIQDKKILIVPLRSGGGIRVKIMEAMAAGKLVVSTTTGMFGIVEAIPNVHYLQADTPNAFAEKIAWILENKDEAEAIAKAGHNLMKEYYDAEKIMDNLMQSIIQNQ
jgi:glycosyltransferase involved in cell wall biosynthesis